MSPSHWVPVICPRSIKEVGRLYENTLMPDNIAIEELREEVSEKIESGQQERNVDRSHSTISCILIPEMAKTSLTKEYKEHRYEPQDVQPRTDQTEAIQMDQIIACSKGEDSAFFPEEKEYMDNRLIKLHKSLYCKIKTDVIFYPAESSSQQTFEKIAIEQWSGNESKFVLIETLLNSLCSSIEEWKGRNKIPAAESTLHETEESLLNLEELTNLCEHRVLLLEWVAQHVPILNHLYGEKIAYIIHHGLYTLSILAEDKDNGESDYFVELSHPKLVKPFAYCWNNIRLLCVYCFMHKGSLENNHFKKYPNIEPVSWDERFKIHTGVARSLTALQSLKKLDINQTFKASYLMLERITKSWLAKTPNKDNSGFTVLDIPSDLPQYGKLDIEIKKTLPRAWALTANDVVKKAIQWWHRTSHLKNTRTMKTKYETKRNFHHLLLLTYTFLAMMTLHAALYISKCRLEEGYNNNLKLNFISWNEPYSNRLFIIFNSVGFFLLVALMIRHFNQLPLRPWLLISVFSVIGTYLCTIKDTLARTYSS